MKISKLVEKLNEVKEVFGDIDVFNYDEEGILDVKYVEVENWGGIISRAVISCW